MRFNLLFHCFFISSLEGTTLKVQAQPSNDYHHHEEEESYICTVRQNVKLHNIMLPPTLKGEVSDQSL